MDSEHTLPSSSPVLRTLALAAFLILLVMLPYMIERHFGPPSVHEFQRIHDLEVQEKMWEQRVGSPDYPMTVIAPMLRDIRDELRVRRGR